MFMKDTSFAGSKRDYNRILFFDGVCGLCSSLVDFALPKLKENQIYFAPLQGSTALKTLSPQDLGLDYVVYLRDGTIHRKTKAVAYLLTDIGGHYKYPGLMLHALPSIFTDFFYQIIAKNRYRIFGKSDTCRLPTPNEKNYFLD